MYVENRRPQRCLASKPNREGRPASSEQGGAKKLVGDSPVRRSVSEE